MVEVYSYARAYKDLLRLNNNGITIKQGRLHGATESKMASGESDCPLALHANIHHAAISAMLSCRPNSFSCRSTFQQANLCLV